MAAFVPRTTGRTATTCDGQVVVGVDVVTVGSDQGQMPPMLDQIEDRFQQRPKEVLVDGGFANREDIEDVQSGGKCEVFAPVAKPRKETVDRHEPKATDSEEVARWRKRMGTNKAKEVYKERAATAECVDAHAAQSRPEAVHGPRPREGQIRRDVVRHRPEHGPQFRSPTATRMITCSWIHSTC